VCVYFQERIYLKAKPCPQCGEWYIFIEDHECTPAPGPSAAAQAPGESVAGEDPDQEEHDPVPGTSGTEAKERKPGESGPQVAGEDPAHEEHDPVPGPSGTQAKERQPRPKRERNYCPKCWKIDGKY
jgi:hypothetical protein